MRVAICRTTTLMSCSARAAGFPAAHGSARIGDVSSAAPTDASTGPPPPWGTPDAVVHDGLHPTLPGFPDEITAYASWSRRVVAYLLDTAIVATVLFLAVGPAYEVAWLPGIGPGVTSSSFVPGGTWWSVATAGALLALQAWTGASPGKRTVGIVVVHDTTLRPAGLVRTVLRYVAHVVDAILYVGFLRPLWHPQRRTFADSICSTVVLRRVRPPVPFLGAGSGTGGRRPSRVVTAAATVLSVGSAVFVLGPTTVAGGAAGATTCGTLDVPGSAVAEDVEVTYGQGEQTMTRWGVTRTGPVAASDTSGDLVATFTPLATGSTTVAGPVEEERVLRVVADDGATLAEQRVAVLVEPSEDGSVQIDVADLDGSGAVFDPTLELRIDAATLATLPSGWSWDVQVGTDGQATTSCGGPAVG